MTARPETVRRSGSLTIALGLAAGPATALGFGRFGYSLVLPRMQAELHWSFTTAGAVNTANMIGYLVGALLAATVVARFGERRAFLGAIVASAAILALSSATDEIVAFSALRLLVGVTGAISFVAGGALTVRACGADSGRRIGLMLGLYAGGAGTGMVVSGAVLEPLLATLPGIAGSRAGWLALGGLALLTVIPAAAASRAVLGDGPAQRAVRTRWTARRLRPILIAYAAFGAGYIAYLTFIVALLRSSGAAGGEVIAFWGVAGAGAAICGFVWCDVLARLTGGRGIALVLAVLAFAAVLPVISTAPVAIFTSAALFGVSFLAVVTGVMGLTRRWLPASEVPAAIGGLTAAFAVGQCVGPVLSGVLSDSDGGVRLGVAVGAVLLAVGALVALAQRELQPGPLSSGDE